MSLENKIFEINGKNYLYRNEQLTPTKNPIEERERFLSSHFVYDSDGSGTLHSIFIERMEYFG